MRFFIALETSQYQKFRAAIIIKKVFEDQDKPRPEKPFYTSTLNKFLVKAFNKLLLDFEVSRLLVARFLLDLLDYYIFDALVKSINISV